MLELNARQLPIGRSTFSALRLRNAIYADKTDLIYRLCCDDAKIFLLRPRRFGKSLLLSTIESLFKDGLCHFSGLSIENYWHDRTYKVVRIDFSEVSIFKSERDFENQFLALITAVFQEEAGYRGRPDLTEFSQWLSKQPARSIVLLIDEYDAPLTACIENEECFESVQSLMRQFFLTLQSNERCFRFFFMTGVINFLGDEIPSGFRHWQDISLNPEYGTLLGFTEEEVRSKFASYLANSAQVLGCGEEALLASLRRHYGGYCFDELAATSVYCPWSVLSFFRLPGNGFQRYWCETAGKPKLLTNDLRQHALADATRLCGPRDLCLTDLATSRKRQDLQGEALLFQSGYLTIKKCLLPGYVEIGLPNKEVATSLAELHAGVLLRDADRMQIGVTLLERTLANQSIDEIAELFNRVFNAIDNQHYPVTNEATCRAILQVLLMGAAMMPSVEVHTAHGRSDLEVTAGRRHWVFEIKFARSKSEVSKLLAEGAAQVKMRQYGERLDNSAKRAPLTLSRAVLVFSAEERRLKAWAEV